MEIKHWKPTKLLYSYSDASICFCIILTITFLLCAGSHDIVWILLGSFLGAFIIVLIIVFMAKKKGILGRTKQSKSFIGQLKIGRASCRERV